MKKIDIAKKQYQALEKVYEFDGTKCKGDRKQTLKKYNKKNKLYEVNYSFSKHCVISNFDNKILKDLESKYSFLASVFDDLDKFSRLKSQKEKKNKCV